MKPLRIKWQRLVLDVSGQTCPRCGSTEKEVEKAVHMLNDSLAPLGVEVALEKEVLPTAVFAKDTLESNKIWIEDKPLEEWLKGKEGRSICCDVCGYAQCRTIEVGLQTYEIIPAMLIVRAGLLAASELLEKSGRIN